MIAEPQNTTVETVEQCGMEAKELAHLAGFFDAVGSITIKILKDSSYRLDYTIQPNLELRRSNDEDPIMGKLMEYCDENGVKYGIAEFDDNIRWVVKEPESIKRFLEPMQEHLVTNYFRSNLMLEVVIPAMEDDKHLTKNGFYDLVGVAEKLREGKTIRGGVKYTQEYFEEEWSIPE